MNHSITVRIPKGMAAWLAKTSRRSGLSRGALVRNALEEYRARHLPPRFLRLVGSIRGPRDLSQRKGFSTKRP